MNQLRIKIFCRSFDLKLYRLSKGLYESWGIPCARLTDQSAEGYFYTMLKHTDCDIAINVDEDCFIADEQAVMDLVEYAQKNGFVNIGISDGGNFRFANPLVTNPFFNIFNLKEIRKKFSRENIKHFDYAKVKEPLVSQFPQEMLCGKYNFDNINQEPYYPFLLWLAANFKTCYLPTKQHQDGISTLVYTPDGRLVCAHSWMARFYSVPTFISKHINNHRSKQKCRIDSLIAEIYAYRGLARPTFGLCDKVAFVGNKTIRWCIKVPQRIMGWPTKLKRRLSRNSNI